jgi:predicted NBD/HSP70 family sugar kinase
MKPAHKNKMNLKNWNRIAIVDYIRRYEKTTRSNLSATTGLTFMTIKNILEELESFDLVRQADYQEGEVGRKAVNYVINKDYAYTLGIHINMINTRVALMNLNGEILQIKKIPMDQIEGTSSDFVDLLIDAINEIIDKSKISREKILGLGIGTPGPVDTKKGQILNPPNLRVFQFFPLAEVMEKKLGFPVYIHKDTNAIAMGEFWRGVGRPYRNGTIVYIDADMGIGSGLIIDGQIQEGKHSLAGEFGHITIELDGPICNCGRRGCLEAVSSGIAVLRQIKEEMLNRDVGFQFTDESDARRLQEVLHQAQEDNTTVITLLNKTAVCLGEAVGSMCNFLDPDLIILGGCLPYEYPEFFNVVRDAANAKRLGTVKDFNMEPGSLSYKAGVIGSGEYVAYHFFTEQINDIFQ